MELTQYLKHWNLSDVSIVKIYETAWQIGDNDILKTGTNFKWLHKNIEISRSLASAGIPVAVIRKTVDGHDYVLDQDRYFFLTEKIHGSHLTDVFTDGTHQKLGFLYGEVIGRLHLAFQTCQRQLKQQQVTFFDNSLVDELNGWIRTTLSEKQVGSVPDSIFKACLEQLSAAYPSLPRQLIHRDIHPGNLLFDQGNLTGYIDFDLSQINARLFDLCYMALSLLIGQIGNETRCDQWLVFVTALLDGYTSLLPLTTLERATVPVMMTAIELLFVAYFADVDNLPLSDNAAEMMLWLRENQDRILSHTQV